MHIDINCDMGEVPDHIADGTQESLMRSITSVNIACGGHASDPDTMYRTLCLARDRGVVVGAHPGYPDRQNFGRRDLPYTPAEITRFTAAQTGLTKAKLGQLDGRVYGLAGLPSGVWLGMRTVRGSLHRMVRWRSVAGRDLPALRNKAPPCRSCRL